MDLDDLKAEWAQRDAALQNTLARQNRLMRELLTEKQRAKLHRKGGMSVFEMVVWIAFLIGFGAYSASTFGEWKFFIPGLLLQAWTIIMGALTFQERARLQEVDFSQPLIDIQKRLAALRIERLRTFQWAFLTGQALWWIPFMIVLFKGLFGVDLYAVSPFMQTFIAANIAVSLAFIPLAWFGARLLGPWLAKSNIAHSLVDGIAGRDLAEARALAARIGEFERGA